MTDPNERARKVIEENGAAARRAWATPLPPYVPAAAPVDRSGEAIETRSGSTEGESAATERSDGGRPTSISGVKELRKALEDTRRELWHCAKQLAAHGQPGSPGDSVDRALAAADAALATQSPPPTDDVVERVARAIYDAEPSPIGDMPVLSYDEQRRLNGDDWIVLKRAHAAIATLSAAPPTDDADCAVEAMGEALANLSANLRDEGLFDRGRPAFKERYEAVVARWDALTTALSAQLPPPINCPGCSLLQQRLDAVSVLAGDAFWESVHAALDAKGAPRGPDEGTNSTYGLIQRIELIPQELPSPIRGEELREQAAEIVYEAMRWAVQHRENGSPPAWVPNGNSFAQNEARKAVRDVLALATPSSPEGTFEARHCPGIPTDCCDFGVISHATGMEVCRVWKQDDAKLIARLLNGATSPEGWVLVPREPTEEMWEAAWEASVDYFVGDDITKDGFRKGLAAMLAASPSSTLGDE